MADSATQLTLRINGEDHLVVFPTHHTLLEVLREECRLTGTKHGCELGECGTCAVLVDGKPILSCLALAAEMEGREIETVEGLQRGNALHPLQATFADLGAAPDDHIRFDVDAKASWADVVRVVHAAIAAGYTEAVFPIAEDSELAPGTKLAVIVGMCGRSGMTGEQRVKFGFGEWGGGGSGGGGGGGGG